MSEKQLEKKYTDETTAEFVQRVCNQKDELDLSWREVASFVNTEVNLDYSPQFYRKHYLNSTIVEALSKSRDENKLLKIQKQRVKLADELNQNRLYVKQLAREETLYEIAMDYAKKMNKRKQIVPCKSDYYTDEKSEKEGILLLSDWHYGIECDNSWNQFSPEICKQRVSKLLSEVIKLIIENKIHHVTVLNLSDLISGRIHSTIRIQNRVDVITQTMDVAEILSEFLAELSSYSSVDYYDCCDNHSRIEPNKKESLSSESFTRFIPWYLAERLKEFESIHINGHEFSDDIITCSVQGHNVIAVHGHQDNLATALEKLSQVTRKHFDLLCMGHNHHFTVEEQYHCVVVCNSSLMGVDDHTTALRKSTRPSQTFIITTEKNQCYSLHRILLD